MGNRQIFITEFAFRVSMVKNLLWFVFAAAVLFQGGECLHCFSCRNIAEDEDCQNATHCTSNQNCYVERNVQGNETRFTMGCIDSQRCPDHHDFTIVGRSAPDHCLECCLTDGCNRELCEVQRISAVPVSGGCNDDPGTNCSRLSTVANICSDIQHAKTICRKHCGLCALVDGDWSQWSNWTSCSTSCGIGSHIRRRSCSNPTPQHGGDNCMGNDTQTHSCFVRDCPVHGEWSNWGAWEGCSVSCGEGLSKRHRTCTNPPPTLYGHYCIGDAVEYNTCHEQPCNNVTTNTSSVHHGSCNDFITQCDVVNSTTGICSQQENARKVCAKFCGLCSIVDGAWSAWSSWSTCSASCDNGTWSRSRTCTDPAPANGGHSCVGNCTDSDICNLRACPVHGGWSTWAHWTTCSSSCGQGLTRRLRTCTNPRPALLGNPCFGDLTEYAVCLIKQCPVDGQWTDWLQWSSCGVSCGSGHMTRQRLCLNPKPSNGGRSCAGSGSDQRTCQAISCPVMGGWSSWSSWSSCTKSCNTGQKQRHRTCRNPAPVGLGRTCNGNSDELSNCNESPCPDYKSAFAIFGGNLYPTQGSSGAIKFPAGITTNIGGHYSKATGQFTCQYPGTYVFALNLYKKSGASGVYCHIRRNGNNVGLADVPSESKSGYYGSSASTVLHLDRGDTVDVGTCNIVSGIDYRTSFIGFLLKAD